MAADDIAAERQRLLDGLDGAVALLDAYRKDHWARWLEHDRRRIAEGEHQAIDHLLSALGGMGSLNDLWILPFNGDPIDPADVEPVNGRLDAYRTEIWTAATDLKASLDEHHW